MLLSIQEVLNKGAVSMNTSAFAERSMDCSLEEWIDGTSG